MYGFQRREDRYWAVVCWCYNQFPKRKHHSLYPKFHCELAGEGIEYAWGVMKRIYRKQPMKVKRSSKGFQSLVWECVKASSINSAQLLSRKTRRYMMVHHHRRLELKSENKSGAVSDWSHQKTEMFHKIYRSHRDVNIIDGVFISKMTRERIGIKNESRLSSQTWADQL